MSKVHFARDPWKDLLCIPDEINDSERPTGIEFDTKEQPSRIWACKDLLFARDARILTASPICPQTNFEVSEMTATTTGWGQNGQVLAAERD
jgi:hypothetical protein